MCCIVLINLHILNHPCIPGINPTWSWCVVVQSPSHIQLFATPWTAACQAPLSSPISQSLLKLMSTELVMLSNPHPLLPPSPSFNLSQHQGLFQWVGSSNHVAKVLELVSVSVLPMNIQDWFPLGLTGLNSLQSKRLSRIFSSTTIQKHQFFGAKPPSWANSHIHTWLLEKP